jgi:FAD synthetase
MTKVTKKVLVFGVFDLLHPGHKWFLRQAKKFGDRLYVIVARDCNAYKQKKRYPQQTERIRRQALAKLTYVTKAQLGARDINRRYEAVIKLNPSIIALGYDQRYLTTVLKRDLKNLKLKTKVVRLSAWRPELYKTSRLRSASSNRLT